MEATRIVTSECSLRHDFPEIAKMQFQMRKKNEQELATKSNNCPWDLGKKQNNAQCVNPRATRETLWRPTSAHACLQRCEKHVKWSNMLQHGLLYMAGILLASARPTNSPQLNPLGWGGHLVLSLRAGPRTEYAKLEVKGGG